MSRCEYWWDDDVKYGLSVATPAVCEPVSVQEVRENSRIYITDDDALIQRQISAARELCETFLKRRFVTTSMRLTLDEFPSWEFYLPSPPLVSVTSIKYRDLSGVQQTLSSSLYTVDAYTEPGRITPAYNQTWPSGIKHTNAVEVIYVAGYGAADAVPAAIKHAICMTVAYWYENREAVNIGNIVNDLPWSTKSLLRSQSWGALL